MSVIEFEGKKPKIHESVFLAPGSWVIGDVTLEEGVNVWTGAIIRGDDDAVIINKNCTILENCIIEAPTGNPIIIGSDTLVSHGATVHGAKIGSKCLIGVGAIVLDGSIIGNGCIVAAGAVCSPRTQLTDNQLALGLPAKPIREIGDKDREMYLRELSRTGEKSKKYKAMYEKK
ncbi:gamma carbonic anhydrase family protein [Candidatus Bathyarchaeota archaeon]|nr:gamma carbonic anhydrase family protein [Candidatus Bathyarchaeota archaeon]